MARVKHGRGHNRGVSYFWVQNAYVETSSANSGEAMPPDSGKRKKQKEEEAKRRKDAEKQAKRVRKEAEKMASQAEEKSPEDDDEQMTSVLGVVAAASS